MGNFRSPSVGSWVDFDGHVDEDDNFYDMNADKNFHEEDLGRMDIGIADLLCKIWGEGASSCCESFVDSRAGNSLSLQSFDNHHVASAHDFVRVQAELLFVSSNPTISS